MKNLIINNCRECIHYLKVFSEAELTRNTPLAEHLCRHPVHGPTLLRVIGEPMVIPLWCPLPSREEILREAAVFLGDHAADIES